MWPSLGSTSPQSCSSDTTSPGASVSAATQNERRAVRAKSSACHVPFRVTFVAFIPLAIMRPLLTWTQPTGVSLVRRASRALMGRLILVESIPDSPPGPSSTSSIPPYAKDKDNKDGSSKPASRREGEVKGQGGVGLATQGSDDIPSLMRRSYSLDEPSSPPP